MRRVLSTVTLLALALSTSEVEAADAGDEWNPAWRRVGAVEYVGAPVALTALVAEDLLFYDKPPPVRWRRPILFDEDVRTGLAASTEAGRDRAGKVSWMLLAPLLAYPLVDAGIARLRGRSDLAWQLFWEDALVLPTAGLVDVVLRDVVGRARPPVSECLRNGNTTAACTGSVEDTRSFPGGHFAAATAGTALLCSQHLRLDLYGGPWDALTCATAIGADATVGVLRIVADKHWASDIFVGGVLGAGIGWGLPTFLHAQVDAPDADATAVRWVPTPLVLPGGAGMGATGMF